MLLIFGLAYGGPIMLDRSSIVMDLTHDVANGYSISWPSVTPYNFTILYRGLNEENGYWFESNDFTQNEHCGTHTDAPSHFAKGRWRVGDIPMERLIGPGVIIDISEKAKYV